MENNEKHIELSEKLENDKEFDNWIQYMNSILEDDSKSEEIESFLSNNSFKEMLKKSIILDSHKRKCVFDLTKKMHSYCEQKGKHSFKFINYGSDIENTFFKEVADKNLDLKNLELEELDDFYCDYFDMIEMGWLRNSVFDVKSEQFKKVFDKSKLHKKIESFILEQNNISDSFVSRIENFLDNINECYYDNKKEILTSIKSDSNEKNDLIIALKTNNTRRKIQKFFEEKDDISDENRECIKEYFEEYFSDAIKSADKFPNVFEIAKFSERIYKYGKYNPTENRSEMYDYIETKYMDLGKGIIQNINIEKIKQGDEAAKKIALKTLNVLTEGFYFFSEVVDGFNYIKEAGLDFLETNEFRKFQEGAYSITFEEAVRKRGTTEEKDNEEVETDAEVTKIEDFFLESQKEIIKQKASIFSKKGSCINNILSLNRLNDKEFQELYEQIRKSYNLDEIDLNEEVRIVDEYINSNDIVENEEEFDNFLLHLQNVKLKQEDNKLPLKYVKYIIKQGLESEMVDVNSQKYMTLMECAILDLAQNDLATKIQKNKPYVFMFCDNVSRNSTLGSHNRNGFIQFKREGLDNLMRFGNIDVINTAFHENVHALQYYDFENPSKKLFSYNRYVMEKEEIIMDNISTFYANNYDKTFIEIEAHEKAAQKTLNFVKSLYPDALPNKKIKFTSLEDINNIYMKELEEKKNAYIPGENVEIDNKTQNVYEIFDEVILKNPECLNEYPDLLLEYHSNGTPKTFEELLDYGMKAETAEEKFLISKIINKSQRMKPENFSKNMDFLMKCFSQDGYEGATQNALVGNAFLKKIVVENVSGVATQILENISSISKDDEVMLEGTIAKINKFMLDPENKKFADAMKGERKSKSNSFKTPHQVLLELSEKLDERKRNGAELSEEDMKFMRSAYVKTEERDILRLENLFVNSVSISSKTVSKEAEKNRDDSEEEKI